jgi:putative ABC transport system substrate-binding protein
MAPLLRGLAKRGYVADKNVAFERRGADGKLERLPQLLDELAAAKVDVIVASGYPPVVAAKEHTKLPVVALFAGDPVGTGLVSSLARPGGHITGISDVSAELAGKRVELLKRMAPELRRIAMLWNANDAGMTLRFKASEAGAKAMGIVVQPIAVRKPEDFQQAISTMNRERPDAILMVSDVLTTQNRQQVLDYAASHRVLGTYEFESVVRDGGLMSYAPDLDETLDRVAHLVDRIFKGAKPGELPFEQPTRFRLVINLKTAKALGVTVPQSLIAAADELIQ